MKNLFGNHKEDHDPYLFENDVHRKKPPRVHRETSLNRLGKKWNVLKYNEINMTGYI